MLIYSSLFLNTSVVFICYAIVHSSCLTQQFKLGKVIDMPLSGKLY